MTTTPPDHWTCMLCTSVLPKGVSCPCDGGPSWNSPVLTPEQVNQHLRNADIETHLTALMILMNVNQTAEIVELFNAREYALLLIEIGEEILINGQSAAR